MKYIWEEKDIEAGLFIIKNTVSSSLSNKEYATTVVFKLGFAFKNNEQWWTATSVLTDGNTAFLACNLDNKWALKTVAELLTAANYRPLKKSELIALIESTDQGFYE